MLYTDPLRDILARQREQTDALVQVVAEIEQTDLAGENERLRLSMEETQKKNEHLSEENRRLLEENKRLTTGLNEQLIIERLGILRRSREQLRFYFGRAESGTNDRLTALEEKYRRLLDSLKDAAGRDIVKTQGMLQEKFDETEAYFQKTLLALKTLSQKKTQAVQEALSAEYDGLAAEAPSGTVTERLRFFNMEMRFGMKIVNILGVLLILLGVVFGLQYTYVNLLRANELKSAAAYLLGFLFLAGGAFARRKMRGRNYFAIGITAGGLGILFASTAISHFSLQVIGALPAAGICMLISLLSFFLSVRHNTRTIACIALIGGYLPLMALSLSGGPALYYGVLVYLTLLNGISLFIATQKKWPFINGLNFILYTLGTLYLLAAFGYVSGPAPCVVYLSFNFLLFIAAVWIYPALRKSGAETLSPADVALLTANTVINCVFLYGLLNTGTAEPFAWNGALAAFFCVVYGAAAVLSGRYLPYEKRARVLFTLTALTFAILVMPFQFGLDRALIGWLAEGTLILLYGVIKKEKWFERAGIGVMILAAVLFAPKLFDAVFSLAWDGSRRLTEQGLFMLDYSLFMLGLVLIAAAYHRTLITEGRRVRVYQYGVVLFGLGYVLYAAAYIFAKAADTGHWLAPLLILCGFAYGAGIKYMPQLRGRAAGDLSLGIAAICAFSVLGVNSEVMYENLRTASSMGLLILFNLLSVLAVYEALRKRQKPDDPVTVRAWEWMPLAVSVYALVLVIMTMTVQYAHSWNSIWLSVVGMLAAFGWIWFGFVSRNRVMRLFGLGFALFATSKLFLADLYFLESIMRVASYFVFGAVLLGISFVYQYFNKKITRGV